MPMRDVAELSARDLAHLVFVGSVALLICACCRGIRMMKTSPFATVCLWQSWRSE